VDHAIAACQTTVAREISLGVALRGFAAVAESERLRLENGVGIPADFLDAEADLVQVKADLTLARTAIILARAELARALGELDISWIEDHLRTANPRAKE
jgi:outer membrane protein TolC